MSEDKKLRSGSGKSDQSKLLQRLNNSTICGVVKYRFYGLFQKVMFLNEYENKYRIYAYMQISNGKIRISVSSHMLNAKVESGYREYISPSDPLEVGWMEQLEEYRNAYIDFGMFQCEEYLNGFIDEIIRRDTE